MKYHVRLRGGRHDGDEDHLDELPTYLWAYDCRCSPRCEGINGIHWESGGVDDHLYGSQPGAEEYRHTYIDNDVHVYTSRSLTDSPGLRLREAMVA